VSENNSKAQSFLTLAGDVAAQQFFQRHQARDRLIQHQGNTDPNHCNKVRSSFYCVLTNHV